MVFSNEWPQKAVSGLYGVVGRKDGSVWLCALAMLPKKCRLSVGAYRKEKGRTYRLPLFTLKIFTSTELQSRFGVVVSAKVLKTAVGRNALRRKFFNVLQSMSNTLPVADYLIIVLPSAARATHKKIYEQCMAISSY